jgi:dTDP-4-amino-4,6-dideoxygalactose transaminase
MQAIKIPFNKPYMTGRELWYIAQAHSNGHLAGDGAFTKKCHGWLEEHCQTKKALLTHSCTAALEIAALLINVQPGDEIIMPSYTFVSTANAFALRGGVPVFVDIRPDTLNINEQLIEAAITSKTIAIVPVHYAGVACDMDVIMDIASRHKLWVIEDAAQGIMSSYKQRPLGSIGHIGCLSFHETKNIISGEGGAILINDPTLILRAEILREKGTNRSQFFRGQVDKYTWCDLGSSYLPGELIAAFLWAQMEAADEITDKRIRIWDKYHSELAQFERDQRVRRPILIPDSTHNAHMYYLLLQNLEDRTSFIDYLKSKNILSVFHYVPLHSAPAGRQYGRSHGELAVTDSLSERLVRLPLWIGVEEHQDEIIESIKHYIHRT